MSEEERAEFDSKEQFKAYAKRTRDGKASVYGQ
jgi:hypothetical protein